MAQLAPGRSSSSATAVLAEPKTKRWIDHSILIGEAVQFADIAQPLVIVTLDPRSHREKPLVRRTSSDRSCERGTRTLPKRCQTIMSRVALQSSRRVNGSLRPSTSGPNLSAGYAALTVKRVRQLERAAEKPKRITTIRPEPSGRETKRDVPRIVAGTRRPVPEAGEELDGRAVGSLSVRLGSLV